jgi:hypothetical protein
MFYYAFKEQKFQSHINSNKKRKNILNLLFNEPTMALKTDKDTMGKEN